MAGQLTIWSKVSRGATAVRQALKTKEILLFVILATLHFILLSSLQGALIKESGEGLNALDAVTQAPSQGQLVIRVGGSWTPQVRAVRKGLGTGGICADDV